MDDLMLFLLGALWRESGVPSLETQGRAWNGCCPPPLKSLSLPHSQSISLLTFPGEVPHLPVTLLAVPKPGSSSQDGQSVEWVVGCLLEWLGPPLVEHQHPPWEHGSGHRDRCRISLKIMMGMLVVAYERVSELSLAWTLIEGTYLDQMG